jgi:hypothetical protein
MPGNTGRDYEPCKLVNDTTWIAALTRRQGALDQRVSVAQNGWIAMAIRDTVSKPLA